MCFHAIGQYFRLLLDIALQKLENMLKSYLWASYNWNQNLKSPTCSLFIAAFV